ncbi:Bro-N domain-containing protein [Mannheimia pernigra]|uniref:BRO-N domain-containing protein n=1 Tax=Mannheimia pernigra TaxID=111844 RepID=UPI00159F425F|nr:BRO family protein [Mannheimia pernigra]QLB44394.1 hypothetical protein HV561_06345 [Mannheimia pernigra]
MSNQLTFQSIALTAISRNNQTYISASDLARALQYADASSIVRIFSRNEDEFTADMSDTVKLTVSGNLETTSRIFSLRGCHLIAMFARTPVAKEFRKWVLDILDKEVSQNSVEKQPLADTTTDQEAVQVITKLFHSLNGGYELATEIQRNQPYLARELEKQIGGHFIYNLQGPTRNALDAARKYIQAKSERIAIVRGMVSLLDGLPTPQPTVPVRKQYGRRDF